jgi:hypothetical protein
MNHSERKRELFSKKFNTPSVQTSDIPHTDVRSKQFCEHMEEWGRPWSSEVTITTSSIQSTLIKPTLIQYMQKECLRMTIHIGSQKFFHFYWITAARACANSLSSYGQPEKDHDMLDQALCCLGLYWFSMFTGKDWGKPQQTVQCSFQLHQINTAAAYTDFVCSYWRREKKKQHKEETCDRCS